MQLEKLLEEMELVGQREADMRREHGLLQEMLQSEPESEPESEPHSFAHS